MTTPSPEPLTTSGENIKGLLDELEDTLDDVGDIKRQYMSKIIPDEEDFNSSQVPIDTVSKREVQDLIENIPKPLIQRPIQPGSSPADEENRFLCWNNTGIIRSQSSQEDQSIDIMFHDTEKHSSVNYKNDPNYTFGSMSEDCVVLGSNGKYSTGPASIHGINLLESNRDNREWEVDLPHVELIESLAAGGGFVAVATDQRNLRLFTNAGMQSYLFTMSGQILCMTAHDRQLMIIYHNGAGHADEQNLSMFVYYIDLFNNIIRQTQRNIPVALSKRSPLSWAGFSDEGTPCTYDYSGMLRIYRPELGRSWVPLLDLRDLTSSALDHYFVVGVSEMSQSVKAVKCKRSRFPEFHTETAELLGFKLPLCDVETDKGKLEEEYVRLRLAELSYKHMSKLPNVGSLAESANESNERLLVNTVLRLFAMYLKEDKEDLARGLMYMIPKSHMSKLPEFAWKIDRPQYFIDSLNKAMEEREALELDIKANNKGPEQDDLVSVSSVASHQSFSKDLRQELNGKHQQSPDKLKPIPLDKLVTNNRLDNEKRIVVSHDEESGDENDAKRAKRTKSINYNLFSKKRPRNA